MTDTIDFNDLMFFCPFCGERMELDKPYTFWYWYCKHCNIHMSIYPWNMHGVKKQ